MAQFISTEIRIDAQPEAVWRVLTDFPAHRDWNPFIESIHGEPGEGERLRVRFRQGVTIRPTVTESAHGRVLEWKGKLLLGGLFDGRHRFELLPEGAATRLVHSERFSGVLVPLFRSLLRETRNGFAAFNEALKRRVEEA